MMITQQIHTKILIVDDRPENIVALEVVLKDFNVEIITATSGNEALSKTLEHDFALALIDVQMPDMDGFETVRLMRKAEKTRLLPVIFLSAIYSEDHYKIQGIEAGAVDFITKPFQPKILLGKVKIFLDLYEQKKKLELEIEHRKKTEENLRETEKKLIEAKLKAEESDRLKTAFLANMSHEIRTPLTSIVGFAGLLSEMNLNSETKKTFADIIGKSSDGLINIINDILDVAKIEAGQFEIVKEPCNIKELLCSLHASFLEVLKKREKTHIDLILSIPEGSAQQIITDENRLKQVISNLVGNAIKFTEEGSIQFGYTIKDNEMEFFVKDTGIGIPKDKFNVIFDRFRKLEGNKTQNASGTGLGLSIVKRIIEMLNGNIWVESEINKGSSFIFTLPLERVTTTEKKTPVSEESSDHLKKLNWSTKKILIVEDDTPTYQLFETMLQFTGAKIHWAQNGKEAIDFFRNNPPVDIVLMDINMPELNGEEAFVHLRKMNKEVPIIAQTAYAMKEDKENLERLGFNGYITKPILRHELLQLMHTFLS
jgi:two-component system, sensor histidine kinase